MKRVLKRVCCRKKGRRRSMSIAGRAPGIDSSGPHSHSPFHNPPRSAISMDGHRPSRSAQSLPLGSARTANSGGPVSIATSAQRAIDAASDPSSRGVPPGEAATTPVLRSTHNGDPEAFYRTRSGSRPSPGTSPVGTTPSRVQVPSPSVEVAALSLWKTMSSHPSFSIISYTYAQRTALERLHCIVF
jgi:hypothetical protein